LHTLIFAVNTLVNTDEGDAFTFEEMSAWLREAGYVNPRLLDVPSGVSAGAGGQAAFHRWLIRTQRSLVGSASVPSYGETKQLLIVCC
jgi:hypothetical protein